MNVSRSLAAATLAALLVSPFASAPVRAGEPEAAMPCHQASPESLEGSEAAAAAEAPKAEAPARFEVPDVEVIDQDGQPRRFYTDLIQGKTVAVNFVFTTCKTVCPPMGANFAKLRKLLSESAGHEGKEVSLISVSIDPGTDTPQRMKEWGAKFGAGPGWTLVTGDRQVVTQLLQALGVYNGDKIDHSPLVLLGDDRTHSWTRTYGLTAPAKLAEMITGLRSDSARAQNGSTAPASTSAPGASK